MNKKKILKWTLILVLPFLILLTNFRMTLFNEDFYKQEFTKLNIYDQFEDADDINKDLLNYFKNNEEIIKNDFFNEKEKSHLADVKKLINFFLNSFYFLLALLTTISVFLFINNKDVVRVISHIFVFSAILTFTKLIFTYVLIRINFSKFFLGLHYVFFPQGNFIFNPKVDNIILLYPSQFFFDITQKIVLDTLIGAFIFLIIGILVMIVNKKK